MDVVVSAQGSPYSACGKSMVVHEWGGNGYGKLHIHEHEDECWHVLEGSLIFKFLDREVVARAGTTVFVPAGTAHDYVAEPESSRYLVILPPRLDEFIKALHSTPLAEWPELHLKFGCTIVDEVAG